MIPYSFGTLNDKLQAVKGSSAFHTT